MKRKIKIFLKDPNEYVNNFNNERISNELISYILDECKTFKLRDKIEFELETEKTISLEEQKRIIKMIKLSFDDDIIELQILLKRFMIMDLIMFIVATFILFLYTFIDNIVVMSEVVLILGWVIMGEALYNFIFSQIETKVKLIKRRTLKNSCIVFKK